MDIFIEAVGGVPPGTEKYFETHAVSVPQYGSSVSELRVRFNLSAYVRDQIAAAIEGASLLKKEPAR